jgi:hypothetical protein
MASLMAIPAKAGEGEWGIAVGLKAISGDLDTNGSELEDFGTLSQPAPEVNKTSISESVEIGAIFIEASGRDGFLGFTSGFEYIPGTASLGTKARTDASDVDSGQTSGVGTYTAKAEIENVITFYIEPTLYVSDNIGLYAKGGVTSMEVNTLETISSGIDSSTYPSSTMVGGVLGYGMRYKHDSGFMVKLEYSETNFKPYDETSTTGNKNRIKAEVDYSQTSLAIGYQF